MNGIHSRLEPIIAGMERAGDYVNCDSISISPKLFQAFARRHDLEMAFMEQKTRDGLLVWRVA